MSIHKHEELAGHAMLPEPALLFAGKQTDTHPLRGLIASGPYSLGLGFPAQVRLAYLAPVDRMGRVEALVSEMQRSAKVREAPNYYYEYPGFEAVFRVPLIPATNTLKFSPPDECGRLAQTQDGDALVRNLLHTIATS